MLILSNKKFEFTSESGQKFCTKGGKIIEEAPEWIKDTILYGLAFDDGDLVEVKGTSDAHVAAAENQTNDKTNKSNKSTKGNKATKEISEQPPEEVPAP